MSQPHLLNASIHLHPSHTMALKLTSPAIHSFKRWSQCHATQGCILGFKVNRAHTNKKPKISCAMKMASEESEPIKIKLEHLLKKAEKVWDNAPQPVKSFPWNRALESFIQLVLDLILAVIKYLSVPVLAVSSLSEISYCAHEKKLFLIPFPILVGVALAVMLKDTALELSPLLKDAEVPWHLIATAIFFTLIKLPGPYYPYWSRVLIPHFANGGLLRTLWFAFLWYRIPKKADGPGVPAGSLREQTDV